MKNVTFYELIILSSVLYWWSLLDSSNSTFIWRDLRNMELIYLVLCKTMEPTSSNYSIKWTKLFGRSHFLKHSDSLFIRSNDLVGSYIYECSLFKESEKFAVTTIAFKLEKCADICMQSQRLLLYSPYVYIDIVDLRQTYIRREKQLLYTTRSPPMNEPNIFYYLVAVILSIAAAIVIIIICIMCYEPYRRGASECSIEDESVQANLKAPPCADFLKVDAREDTRVCKEYKKSTQECKGSRRTVYTIENTKLSEMDDTCQIPPEKTPVTEHSCPMKRRFRDATRPVNCPTCPTCPNYPPPYQPEVYRGCVERRITNVPLPETYHECANFPQPRHNPQCCKTSQPSIYPQCCNIQQPNRSPTRMGARQPHVNPQCCNFPQQNISPQCCNFPQPRQNIIFPKLSQTNSNPQQYVNPYPESNDPLVYTNLVPKNNTIIFNDPLQNTRPQFYNDLPQNFNHPVQDTRPRYQNDLPLNVHTPTQAPPRRASNASYYNVVAVPRKNSREVDVSEGYADQNRAKKYKGGDVKGKSNSLPFLAQRSLKQYNKNRIIEKRIQ